MPTEYDEAVRDRTLGLVESRRETPVTRRVEREEYDDDLAEKLLEERGWFAERVVLERIEDGD